MTIMLLRTVPLRIHLDVVGRYTRQAVIGGHPPRRIGAIAALAAVSIAAPAAAAITTSSTPAAVSMANEVAGHGPVDVVVALVSSEPVTADLTPLRRAEEPTVPLVPTPAPLPPAPPSPPAATGSPTAIINEIFGSVAPTAIRVARCESSLDPAAMSPGGGNHGLFQINNVHAGKFASVTGRPWADRYDARTNTVYAKYLYDSSGWVPWACRPRR